MESVPEPRRLLGLMAAFGAEMGQNALYASQNPDWIPPNLQSTRRFAGRVTTRLQAHYLSAAATAWSDLAAIITSARQREVISDQTEVTIMHGDCSTISKLKPNTELAEKIDKLGVKSVRLVTLQGQSHGLIDGLSLFTAALQAAS